MKCPSVHPPEIRFSEDITAVLHVPTGRSTILPSLYNLRLLFLLSCPLCKHGTKFSSTSSFSCFMAHLHTSNNFYIAVTHVVGSLQWEISSSCRVVQTDMKILLCLCSTITVEQQTRQRFHLCTTTWNTDAVAARFWRLITEDGNSQTAAWWKEMEKFPAGK